MLNDFVANIPYSAAYPKIKLFKLLMRGRSTRSKNLHQFQLCGTYRFQKLFVFG